MRTLKARLAMALAMSALLGHPASADLVAGGPTTPAKKLAADCYAEVDVLDLTAASVDVNDKGVPTIACMEGRDCDQSGPLDERCVFALRTCINQDNVEGCTPPSETGSLAPSMPR